MPRFTALLRGVNVGRANRVTMAEFRALLLTLGYLEVRTLLNSGNAVFTSAAGPSRVHADRIRNELSVRLGVDVPVIVKSATEMAAIEAANPLVTALTDASRLLVAFAPDVRALAGLRPIALLSELPRSYTWERMRRISGARMASSKARLLQRFLASWEKRLQPATGQRS